MEEESLPNLPSLPNPASLPNPSNSLNPSNHDFSKSQRYQQRFAEPTNDWKGVRTPRPLGTQRIGVYTWQLDGALAGLHIAAVYSALAAEEASILSQCRTGHSRLRNDLYRLKMSDTAGCECGAT